MGDPPPDPADGAEALAEWLAACDDALLSGRPLALPSAADGVPQAETELAWLLWVRSVWPADDPLSADTVATGPTEPLPQSVGPPSDSPPDRLLCRLELSGLLDPTELAAARAWAGRVPPTEAAATGLADHLVSSGKLTRFQADGLLAGRTRFTLAGRYVILDRLGAGGMGMVFHCRHAVMRHTVAVKLISEQLASDPENAERFRREARAAASLRHPNVVRALEMDQDDGRPFLVMEYVEGRTLADIVRRDGPLPVDAACDYAAQAADGLQAAHDTGLVHRDVKPANLLVDGDGVVKLVDLGLARFASDEADGLTANNTAILGTVDYLSPEQAMDSHRADARSDVYSLGATFYFLLTGRAPFQGRGTAEKLLAHQVRDPEPVQSVRPDVPDPVAAVLSRMLAKDPAQRFPTAAAAAAALRGETPVPPPVEPVAAPSGPSRAAWRLVAGSVVAGLVTLAVLVSSGRTNPAPKPAHRVVTPIEAATPPREVVPDPPPDWAAEVAKLPAEEQLAAVVRKLRENNPGYDGAVLERAFEAGAVVSLALPGQQLRGVSALRGLPRLRTLSIRATNEKPGVLAELRPLADLPLIDLRVSNCPVTDLTPLAGLPLTTLHLPNCPVYDLGPLRGMPL